MTAPPDKPIGTPTDLETAVNNLRSIEASLADLAKSTESVSGAGQRLADAETTLKGLRSTASDALEQQTELTQQLSTLATGIAEAIEVVRQVDPSKIYEAIEELTRDFERQKERINEMSGELRVRIEDAVRSIDVSVADSAEEINKAQAKHQSTLTAAVEQSRTDVENAIQRSEDATAERVGVLQRKLWIPTIAAAALSGIAVVLVVVVLLTN
jgi:hypothetical protein